ncbi:MAG: hypothetical protein QM831_31115 [Kofleriaceae bacterium]
MRYLVVIVLAACSAGEAPASIDSGKVIDATTARCDPAKPFGTPQPLAALNGPTDDMAARLSADELTVLFGKIDAQSGKWDIYQATRTATSMPFGSPQVVGPLNTIYDDIWPTTTPDGKTLFMTTDRVGNQYSIFTAHRTSVTDTWDTPTQVSTLNMAVFDPYVPNASSLYVHIGGVIQHVLLTADGTAGMPTPVIGGVNDGTNPSVTPVVSPDELHIYFGRQIGTNYDIYEATRSTVNDGFGVATPLPGLADPTYSELPSWVSADGCELYLSTDMGVAKNDLYVATRP